MYEKDSVFPVKNEEVCHVVGSPIYMFIRPGPKKKLQYFSGDLKKKKKFKFTYYLFICLFFRAMF